MPRNANDHDASLMIDAVQARDGASVAYLVLCYGLQTITWDSVFRGMSSDDMKFVSESLLAYEDQLEREEHSW